jgi:hypothetical protein
MFTLLYNFFFVVVNSLGHSITQFTMVVALEFLLLSPTAKFPFLDVDGMVPSVGVPFLYWLMITTIFSSNV